MFDKLNAILERGGTVTIDQLARELDTTPEVAREMLEYLVHSGWLHDLALVCDQPCTECVLARDCTHFNRGRVWQVNSVIRDA